MKFLLLSTLILFANNFMGQKYWQQRVDYNISVSLDDITHYLKGYETFIYTNNSPNELNEIHMHLWPNAYKNKETALAKQQYKSGENILFYGDASEKGWIDSLNFTSKDGDLEWNFNSEHQDIAIIKLNKPLKSGENIEISTPFRVKIPSGEISRLGHIGQSYQITQWYPKPAVYDKNGWHSMPYLDQGEFYSEFGSFDVFITLPKNYVVGATGDLVKGDNEIAWLEKKVTETELLFKENKIAELKKNGMNFPESSKELKTLHYHQENVHDFAWFSDKRYYVLKGKVELPHSKKKVTTWAMFTINEAELWEKSIEYLNDATYYYSLWNGDYPYKQVTAVDGTISAGGGMEYPNVTVIGNSSSAIGLEIVIVHEVGHNWFYGILGSNEREHGWMDEGLNTLNEMRYIQTKYPDNQIFTDMFRGDLFNLEKLNHHDMGDYSCHMVAKMGEDQPIETHSADFKSINYGIIMYQKTGLVFYYLKDYLGDELFDQCMQEYYRKWKYKHPQPEDIKEVFVSITKKNLDWIFEDLIKTTRHIDYKIKSVKNNKDGKGVQVKVKNVGQVDGPIELNVFSKNNKALVDGWIEPGNDMIIFKELDIDSISKVVIDENREIPEINRQNNYWKSNGLFKKIEPVKLEFLIGDEETNKTNLFWLPLAAWNSYDKLMVGAGIHNLSLPGKPFQYLIAPFYSFGRKFISGTSEFSYTFLPIKHLKTSRFGLSIKSYKYDTIMPGNDSYFIGASPYWMAKIGDRNKVRTFSKWIKIQGLYRMDKSKIKIFHSGGFIKYSMDYDKPNHKMNTSARFDYIRTSVGDQVARGNISSEYRYRYLKNKLTRWLSIRGFLGNTFLYKNISGVSNRYYQMSLSGANGMQDVFLEGYYFFRSASNSRLRAGNWGGFNSNSNFGTTSFWMASANAYIQLPIKPNIFGAFADYGTFFDGYTTQNAYNFGLGIRFGEMIGIYFPLYRSSNMGKLFTNNYSEEIRLTLKFNLINKPLKLGISF